MDAIHADDEWLTLHLSCHSVQPNLGWEDMEVIDIICDKQTGRDLDADTDMNSIEHVGMHIELGKTISMQKYWR